MRSTCSVEDCNGLVRGGGYCGKHYVRFRRYGDPTHPFQRSSQKGLTCSDPDCEKAATTHGYCGLHWHRVERHGDSSITKHSGPYNDKPCKVEGCGKKIEALDYCERHYMRLKKNGDPLTLQHVHSHPEGSIIDAGNGGYTKIKVFGHRNADKSGWVLEHVFVMSKFLGRSLYNGETVHHKNGIRNDNRLDNLELWSKNHGSGQRVQDKISWMVDFICNYEAFLDDRQLDRLVGILKGRR